MRFVFLNREGQKISLDQRDEHHLRVMRKTFPLRIPALLDNSAYMVEISGENSPYTVEILEEIPLKHNKPRHFLVPLIDPKRLEFLVEKLVELGASSMQFYFSDHTSWNKKQIQKFALKIGKMESLVRAACQQCFQMNLPEIMPPVPLEEALAKLKSGSVLALGMNASENLESGELNRYEAFLIGPEGDFSKEEYQRFEILSVEIRKLEIDRVYRSETAMIYLASLLDAS